MAQLDSATFTWKIDNFANLNNLNSYQYSCDLKTKQAKFWLRCYPQDNVKDMNKHILIYLLRDNPHRTDLKVLWTLSLINNKGKECYPKDIETKFTVLSQHDPIEGGLYNLHRDIILKPSNGLLPGGKLIIKCTVTTLDDQNSANFAKLPIEDKRFELITLAQKNTLGNYQALLESSKLSDVVFVIGKKEFKLHKAILASQSPVFSAMFENDLEEAKQNRVEIIDVDVEVFEVMIRFIYTANVDSVQQYALDLFVAADKYQLDSLKNICAQSLGSNLSIESVANILLIADMHSEAELKSKCIKYINNKNTTKVFATDGWKELAKTRHQLVLELYYDSAHKLENK